ncbi:Alcohol dehydrogenase-like 3 [Acorus calamus]|uniref:Alcohol dehydrogenase-like 3 n=1 Tax=Acorus calamus TaxID=4465 RepID=A0AAV9FMA6_ACOCL|nr:Alcohol dehydrogenase-like 3 [Acorus calamus]
MIGDGKTRFFTKNGGQPIHHFLNISSFTEYTVLESACVVKINPKAPLEKMSLLGCGISTGSSRSQVAEGVRVIRKMTKGGVDFSFECAGNVYP